MKTGVVSVEAVNILCPYCGEPHPDPSGSHLWTAEDFRRACPRSVTCTCGEAFRIEFRKTAHLETRSRL